jgi:methyl-accepting chemotaxis protein
VVADEVRRLAERTGQATRTIGHTIGNIQEDSRRSLGDMEASLKEVERGLHLADEARQSLGAIVESTQAGATKVETIVRAAQEQAIGTDRLAEELDGVLQIARSTDEAANEVRAATERFAGLAADLHGAVRRFKVGSGPDP